MISVVQLGTVDYASGLRAQQQLLELRKEGKIGDVLLLLQHSPVITLGRNAKTANILFSNDELNRRGVELFETDRGGDVTFHGPGQLVGYPIFDLHGFPNKAGTSTLKYLGAVDYVRRIEEVLIRTCLDFTIPTKRIPGLTGVWTDWASKPEAKIAAIGVHISRSVTSHGFALNVNTDLSYFNLIVPCGIENKPVTSIAQELEKDVSLDDVAQAITRNFGRVFDRQILWVDTLDALLGRIIGVPMKQPEELRRIHGSDSRLA
ncbi:MAG TPA: lipoyl(octanoyl) transferase LipB [Terriglobales bacterium]|nr:lipoyl(octanoyl) transferase LipB [Terriglobales bacterium]